VFDKDVNSPQIECMNSIKGRFFTEQNSKMQMGEQKTTSRDRARREDLLYQTRHHQEIKKISQCEIGAGKKEVDQGNKRVPRRSSSMETI